MNDPRGSPPDPTRLARTPLLRGGHGPHYFLWCSRICLI